MPVNLKWYAVRAKATHEKRVAALFEQKHYECFLPLYGSRRRWSDRVKQVELPLFPGYVFCRFVLEERISILTTPSVLSIAGAGKTPMPVDDVELNAIRRVAKSGLGLTPEPFRDKGRRVRINGGALEGLEGMIEDTRHQDRLILILSVTLLQRSVAVEMDRAWVTPLPTRPEPLRSFASARSARPVVRDPEHSRI